MRAAGRCLMKNKIKPNQNKPEMETTLQRLQNTQLPDVILLGIGVGPAREYLIHVQSFIGLALNKASNAAANAAMHIYFKSEACCSLERGGDLLTEYCKGALTTKIYTHPLGVNIRNLSFFVTIEGAKVILNSLPNQREPVKQKLLSEFGSDVFSTDCNVVSETPVIFPTLVKKRRIAGNTASEEGVYVLRFTDGSKPLFYVGKSSNIQMRIQQHTQGQGAACTTGREFTRVPCLAPDMTDMESWERSEVLERMHQFGMDSVRGWKFTLRTMPLAQRVSAFDDVCERFDLCRRCGRGSHFIRECEALTTDRWTNGMELRSCYHNTQAAVKEIARLESQVDEERTARLKAESKNADAVKILLANSDPK